MFSLREKKLFHGWSMAQYAYSYVLCPNNIDELKSTIKLAGKNKLSICPIGSARSYGDEILNEDNILVDCTYMNRILSWDPKTGIMTVEPGVTLQQALKVCLKDNWILPVVPGTRYPSVGGCASNNVHGKNSFKDGNFGDWVLEFDILLSSLEIITCSKENNQELFFAGIGGLGMLGFFTKIKIQLKKVPSPYFVVRKWTVPNLKGIIEDFIQVSEESDYIVGQVDCFSMASHLGRGTIHSASYTQNKSSKNNYFKDLEVPERISPIIPDSWVLNVGKISMSPFTMRCISSLKYYSDSFTGGKKEYVESSPKFHFLLDRIPYWPGLYKFGFFEFEPLIPSENAITAFREIITLSHRYKVPPYIAGIKYHKKDEFLMSFALDGFSIGFDFPVLPDRKEEQRDMFYKMHEITAQHGGIVYLAKDNLMVPEHFKKMYKTKIIEFVAIKKKYDPDILFQSNLFRRLFMSFFDE